MAVLSICSLRGVESEMEVRKIFFLRTRFRVAVPELKVNSQGRDPLLIRCRTIPPKPPLLCKLLIGRFAAAVEESATHPAVIAEVERLLQGDPPVFYPN